MGLSKDGLQSIPRESKEKDTAAMLAELTIEANEESFVIILQHGLTWKQSIVKGPLQGCNLYGGVGGWGVLQVVVETST